MIAHIGTHYRQNGSGFVLKHFDDKGDHILVNTNFNITGMIDWEFASAEPKALAFSTPCMLWPVGDFYDGKGELSAEEIEFAEIFEGRGREDMGQIVRESRKMQRFTFFNGGGVSRDPEEFQALFTGLRAAWARKDDPLSSYDDWTRDASERLGGDDRLQILLHRSRSRIFTAGRTWMNVRNDQVLGTSCSCHPATKIPASSYYQMSDVLPKYLVHYCRICLPHLTLFHPFSNITARLAEHECSPYFNTVNHYGKHRSQPDWNNFKSNYNQRLYSVDYGVAISFFLVFFSFFFFLFSLFHRVAGSST
jgi:hypothetical protein